MQTMRRTKNISALLGSRNCSSLNIKTTDTKNIYGSTPNSRTGGKIPEG
jgi:hypothetical protein